MATTHRTVLAVVLLTLVAFTNAQVGDSSPDIAEILPGNSLLATPEALLLARGLRQRVINQGGCNPNVCFALDGSRSIGRGDYRRQREFVQLIAAIIGQDTESAFAAVQYGARNVAISSLTNRVNLFLKLVGRSRPAGSARVFIAAGLGFCIQELRARPEDANKIVLLGDGRSRSAGNPARLARTFREPMGNGSICAVAVGFNDRNANRLVRITGSETRVLSIRDYFELLDILDQLITEICDYSA